MIAQTLEAHNSVQVIPVEEAYSAELHDTNLLLIGCPTQQLGPTSAMRAWLDGIAHECLRGVKAAVFDTRYRISVWSSGSAAWIIARLLQQAGASLILPPESFFVASAKGPLEDGELEHAELARFPSNDASYSNSFGARTILRSSSICFS
jgi:hypothetical protein